MNRLRTDATMPKAVLTTLCAVTMAVATPSMLRGDVLLSLDPARPFTATGKDDVPQLKHLAAGVGWEFEPNAGTTARLKQIGIRSIRCINVDPLPGTFEEDGKFTVDKPDRLLAHLATCREIGANPHVIIATGLHPDLRVTVEDIPEAQRGVLGNQANKRTFGPKDWRKFQQYCQAYFEYVLVTQGFPHAEFEVANEPDIGGAMHPFPPKPANGAKALYEGYFNLYKNVAEAAQDFERTHPNVKVKLGGPALAWAFTFKYGDFNWAERFLRDCGEQKVKLDFLGLHFYGNISSLAGEYEGNYPSFREMLKTTQAARDQYCPGAPIQFTEWGASYHTSNDAASAVNGNHIGAAWAAAFLNTMLETGVDSALYLVTTDLRQQAENGKWETVWGWPSLFVNPHACGGVFPKAPFHVFEMVSRLEGTRIEATHDTGAVNCFASADKQKKRLTVMVWNYGCRIPEGGEAEDKAATEHVTLRVSGAQDFFGASKLRVRRWLVSEDTSNAYALIQKGERLDDRAELQQVQDAAVEVKGGSADIRFDALPSSVSFVEVSGD